MLCEFRLHTIVFFFLYILSKDTLSCREQQARAWSDLAMPSGSALTGPPIPATLACFHSLPQLPVSSQPLPKSHPPPLCWRTGRGPLPALCSVGSGLPACQGSHYTTLPSSPKDDTNSNAPLNQPYDSLGSGLEVGFSFKFCKTQRSSLCQGPWYRCTD